MKEMEATFKPTTEVLDLLLDGGRRTEYVVENPITIEGETESGKAIRYPTAIREEVVRCRDCAHWRKPTKHERSKCTGAMAFVEPTPDGFCAWGKRREES